MPDDPLSVTKQNEADSPRRWRGGRAARGKTSPRLDKTLKFTVDSALLRELGERLVGRPHVALAELVKNAYDADAHHCEIRFGEDRIEVADDGHGMTLKEFRDFWMRIGTTNKQKTGISRKLERRFTGSKGIGRLAVQFLGRRLEIVTTSEHNHDEMLRAMVDWDAAVEAGDLTEATASYGVFQEPETYANASATGVKIVLSGLNHKWTYKPGDGDDPFMRLAQEIWMLQPPFVDPSVGEEAGAFAISLIAQDEEAEKTFREQLSATLDLWDARITGRIRDGRKTGTCELHLQFRDGDEYDELIPLDKGGLIDQCDFEIRIFKLQGKQPRGISVGEAREYFNKFGGVHIYDGGFRLPYYGMLDDWLDIEFTHAHRRSLSDLLPERLRVPLAMHDLPTRGRIFGVTHVNTARELSRAPDADRGHGNYLKINIGRDRLVQNDAYDELKHAVRWSLDYYTSCYQLRQMRTAAALRPIEPPSAKLERLWETIVELKNEVSPVLYEQLVEEVDGYYNAQEKEQEYAAQQQALLAPLAAAGMAALAFEHESNRELKRLAMLTGRLEKIDLGKAEAAEQVAEIATALTTWISRIRASRKLFTALVNREDREEMHRLRLKATLDQIVGNTRPFLRGIEIFTTGVPSDLYLPLATMADWQALFQNILINAANAMVDADSKRIVCFAGAHGQRQVWLHVNDSGCGVDLGDAERLFEPFVRALEISPERASLGLGGHGLGLTIVRMIAETRKCHFGFVEADEGYSTTFELRWSTAS